MTMKRMGLLALAAASLLVGCTPTTAAFDALATAATAQGPSTVADRTVLDEKAAIAVEVAYQASALAILTATRAGMIEGETATKVAAADANAYQAVLLVRAAYNAGNAKSYADAAAKAVVSIKSTIALLKGS